MYINKKARLIMLLIALIVMIGVGYYLLGNFDFLLNDFWFTSGALLLILLSLIDQPHFSKDSNVFVNAVTAIIALLLIPEINRGIIFWVFLILVIYLLISSSIVMWKNSKPLKYEKKWLQFISRINRQIGKPETLFSLFFLWGTIIKFGTNSSGFNALLICWGIFMIVNIPVIANIIIGLFSKDKNININNAVATIFGIQSNNTFFAKLLPDRKENIKAFDFVEFVSGINKTDIKTGWVVDTYMLNQEQWIKILTTEKLNQNFEQKTHFDKHQADIVYKINDMPSTNYLDQFIGIVIENSTIDKIRFIYHSNNSIEEGNLLEVEIGAAKIYYQVIEGITKIEQLENKNEAGFIVGEAIQLGVWNQDSVKFEPFGWLPEINTPVCKAQRIADIKNIENEFQIGEIPNSNFPVVINKEWALTHHTAIIGVTGTGKSVFSRNLIREYLKDDNVKIICIDFTGEYKDKFIDLKPVNIVNEEDNRQIYTAINTLFVELAKFENQRNQSTIDINETSIDKIFTNSLCNFLKGESNISIIELSDLSNTSDYLEYIRQLFNSLFKLAKNKQFDGNRICIVLEEAHTIIPEWNAVGVIYKEKTVQSCLNSIAQIALQGRKYDIGLLVIAQRTANVSKTILTQCNTVISFQVFDKTSEEFLSNYFGDSMAKRLHSLKFRQAIVAGKALKSNVPVIFEVPDI